MRVKIYDTHVRTDDSYYHFDVVVENATQQEVENYAKEYLDKINVKEGEISQKRCEFCHEEIAEQKAIDEIMKKGYFIIPMQGCPQF